ncbi:hypothetical protein HN385_03405 [archaeon]|jgi:hypothetical protein|nr:hypothetical protein [archaeon]MBT3451493.1 hypothetical protein [archaeon]MBT6869743.1 hypothetical protein [archaeon]MBT7192698.1 hypothetical protein [archaeon]MBT7380723.1 hypothetical protein [archaeon]
MSDKQTLGELVKKANNSLKNLFQNDGRYDDVKEDLSDFNKSFANPKWVNKSLLMNLVDITNEYKDKDLSISMVNFMYEVSYQISPEGDNEINFGIMIIEDLSKICYNGMINHNSRKELITNFLDSNVNRFLLYNDNLVNSIIQRANFKAVNKLLKLYQIYRQEKLITSELDLGFLECNSYMTKHYLEFPPELLRSNHDEKIIDTLLTFSKHNHRNIVNECLGDVLSKKVSAARINNVCDLLVEYKDEIYFPKFVNQIKGLVRNDVSGNELNWAVQHMPNLDFLNSKVNVLGIYLEKILPLFICGDNHKVMNSLNNNEITTVVEAYSVLFKNEESWFNVEKIQNMFRVYTNETMAYGNNIPEKRRMINQWAVDVKRRVMKDTMAGVLYANSDLIVINY